MRRAAGCRARSRSGSCRPISRRAATSATSRSWCASASKRGSREREARAAVVLREGQDGVVAAERHAAVLGITGVPDLHLRRPVHGLRRPGGRHLHRSVLDQVADFAAAREIAAVTPLRAHRPGAHPHRRGRRIRPCALHGARRRAVPELRRAARGRRASILRRRAAFAISTRQLAIWNAQVRRRGAAYDAAGRALDRGAALPPRERVDAILHWSALPGASRHHWGTDLDLIDRRARARRATACS